MAVRGYFAELFTSIKTVSCVAPETIDIQSSQGDRTRLRADLSDLEVARRRSTILALTDSVKLVEMDSVVLDRAAQSMPTERGTLDAIHLA